MSDVAKRLHTLLTDRACEGLDEQLETELVYLLAGAGHDLSYEQAAAGIELALLPHDEPLPAALTATLLAQADDYWLVSPAPAPAEPGRPVSGTTQTGYMPADLRAEAEAVGGPAHWTGPQPKINAAIEDHRGSEPSSADELEAAPDELEGKRSRKGKRSTTKLEPSRAANTAAYLSAIAAVLVLGMAFWLYTHPRGEDGEDLEAIEAQLAGADDKLEWTFVPTEDPALGEDGGGSLVWSSDLQAGVMTLHGLAANQPTEAQYQLWIVDETRNGPPVDGGVFDIDAEGEVQIPIDAKLLIGRPKTFTITVERPGGVVVSGQERVVMLAAAP